MTSIGLPKQFVSLAVLLDGLTRRIRGWPLAGHMMESLPKAALQHALSQHRPEIHHSHQGVLYAATGDVNVLQEANVQIRRAAGGQPPETASIERFLRTLKEEEVCLHGYEDLQDPRAHLAHFLEQV